MAFLHRCKEFNEAYSHSSDKKSIDSIIKKLENYKEITQTKTTQKYSSTIYIYKRTTSRIIIEEYTQSRGGPKIYFLRNYFAQAEYDVKWHKTYPKITSGEWLKENPLSDAEIREAIIKSTPKAEEKLPEPPAEMTKWLENFKLRLKYNVYESEHWVNFTRPDSGKKESMKNAQGSEYFHIIKHITKIEKAEGVKIEKLETNSGNRVLNKASKGDVCIIYEMFCPNGFKEESDSNNLVYLHGGGCKKTQQSVIEVFEEKAKVSELLDSKGVSVEIFSKLAHKAYPLSKSTSLDEWMTIERNEEVINLALLEEQIALLKDIEFPRFINGQAGSGKSTILFFLFAEICFQKICDEENFKGDVVFLTENIELLKQAKDATGKLLKYNSEYASWQMEDNKVERINSWFHPFLDFLTNTLLDEEFRELFRMESFIKFYDFKNLYINSKIRESFRKKYSAELCWYVITTFIKGYKYDKYLTPEEFKEIPKKDKNQIDQFTYQEIYNNVWIPFYKNLLEQENKWDKLDLVRFILNSYLDIENKYWVIFCDEAQDFTRIELQLLIKLSEFKNFDLSGIKQLPLLFAGDPFQTVNPIGFNLERFKNLLHDEFIHELKFSCLEENIITNLRYNYRSVQEIVDLANLIQFIRFHFFDLKGIKEPQSSKWMDPAPKPVKYTLSKNDEEQIAVKIRDRIILVPCEYGEEVNYAMNDSMLMLRNFGGIKDNEWVIKSAAKSKGSEYSHVVLYKFGDYFRQQFSNIKLSEMLSGQFVIPDNELFRISFFFNKLYVSLTRARKKLEIIDTEEGMSSFWDILLQHHYNEKADYEQWKSIKTAQLVFPAKLSDFDDLTNDQIIANAENDEKSGSIFREPEKMESAAKLYRKAGEYNRANICEALALEFAKKYSESGDKYKSIGAFEDAKRCYWINGDWQKYIAIAKKAVGNEEVANNLIVNLMLHNSFDPSSFATSARHIREIISKDQLEWKNDLLLRVESSVRNKLKLWTIPELKNCAKIVYDLQLKGRENEKLLALLYFSAEEHEAAIKIWQHTDDINHKEYYISKYEIAKNEDDQIYWISKISDKKCQEKIFSIYKRATSQGIVLKQETKNILKHILLERQEFFEYLLVSGETIDWNELNVSIGDKGQLFELFLTQLRDMRNGQHASNSSYFTPGLIGMLIKNISRESVYNSFFAKSFCEQLPLLTVESISGRFEQGLANTGSQFRMSSHIIHGKTSIRIFEYISELLADNTWKEQDFHVITDQEISFSPLANITLAYLCFLTVHAPDYYKTSMFVNASKALFKSSKADMNYFDVINAVLIKIITNENYKEATRINTFILWLMINTRKFAEQTEGIQVTKTLDVYIREEIKKHNLYNFNTSHLNELMVLWLTSSDDTDLVIWKNRYLAKETTARFTSAIQGLSKETSGSKENQNTGTQGKEDLELLKKDFLEKNDLTPEQIAAIQKILNKKPKGKK